VPPDPDTPVDAEDVEARVERLLQAFKQAHLEDWNSQKRDLLRQKKEWRAEFEDRIRQRWGDALDEYEAVVEAAMSMWRDFNKRWFYPSRAADDHQTVSLIELHSRCLRVAQEVLALLSAGYAAGAHARVRTMHELAVVAMFLKENPPNVARRYQEHAVVERHKRAKEYNATLAGDRTNRGYEPIDDATIKALAEQRDRLKKRYGPDFVKGGYSWAASALGNKRPTFRDLEKSVNMGHLRAFYAWSSQEVHAGSHGNELSYAERASGAHTLNAGPSNGGLADPAAGAMVSLLQATSALCMPTKDRGATGETCTVEKVYAFRLAEVNALHELVEKAQQAFLAVHKRLEEDERRAWDSAQPNPPASTSTPEGT
jgi:hypothetical protein